MPFTTQLGRNWEVWQAYREIYSNMLDEGGAAVSGAGDGDTVFTVSGPSIDAIHADRGTIFIQSKPIAKTEGLEVHEGKGRYVFYRGVRAGVLPEDGRFTYNITAMTELSEDRTFKSMWDVEYKIETLAPAIKSRDFASKIIAGDGGKWDQKLNFGLCGRPSEEFIAAAKSESGNAKMNLGARALLEKDQQENASFNAVEILTDEQANIFAEAIALARRAGADIEADEITISETLGPNTYGLYHKASDRIFLNVAALDNGIDHTAATVFEEWAHKRHKVRDNTRGFQDLLLGRIVQLAKEIEVDRNL